MKNKNKILNTALLGMSLVSLSTTLVAAEQDPIKVGVMLPFSGVYGGLGEATRNGLKMALQEHAADLQGRKIEFIEMDTEAKPSRAPEIANSLLNKSHADFIIGPVHSGVAMGMIKVLKDKDTIMIIPNAGVNAATGPLCAPNIFRTSFSAWQPSYPMGKVALEQGFKKVVTLSWNYGFGQESLDAFEESFTSGGGEIVKKMLVPFPKTEFQSYLSEIGSIQPDAVFVFFAGGGAVKFVKDYDAMGLKGKIPLLGAGFLTEGTLEAQGDSAEGILTTLHYADPLKNEENQTFRRGYADKFGKPSDLYAVQGYDTGLMIASAVKALNGDISDQKALIHALENTKVKSPRGDFTFSKAHNPIQNIYLRRVENGENQVVKLAASALEDPARGCSM
ncbi:ABC transporter substrate-binding protein [Marinomonas polaris]|jgi:branched-chain amino acid transport system substrate-binding protein|uniref:Amino acid/amide ABC transporter substrate-binding protein, HAAT family n=1 Tax=Marinomonas polaris DSM 16579 TaxID=1122206 RepID=A0A1M4V7W8_9GAMM|nr:ABC transporter substrate-binding protein [Marinomonas polaris]SHE65065.1 amino acid/amide ABC transporter substrate-binding protein, HAAT family [Marinomonas polaris DSM 16579]|tara:strand:- start:9603 stop:10778 length:1176 start_codon:yes stop_codon:yes gene_type:complete